MWKSLSQITEVMKQWLLQHQRLEIFPPTVTRDFTKPTADHWISFEGGDVDNAIFRIRGDVAPGDYLLTRMCSGRIGRYRVYSRVPMLSRRGFWRVKAMAVGYWDAPASETRSLVRPIKGLLGDGTRWIRSNSGELAHLPRGFTKPDSEFWKIYHRNEINGRGTNSNGTTSNR